MTIPPLTWDIAYYLFCAVIAIQVFYYLFFSADLLFIPRPNVPSALNILCPLLYARVMKHITW